MVQLSVVMLATAAPYAVLFATVVPFRAGAIILAIGACLAPVAIAMLRINPRSYVAAGHTLTAVLYGAVVALMCVEGGLASLATAWLIVPPMFAILLLGQRAAWVWTTISVTTIVTFLFIEWRGVVFPVKYPVTWAPPITAATYVGLTVCTAVLVLVFEDIRAAAQSRAESASVALARLAYVDTLTGLANRAQFEERLEGALTNALSSGDVGRVGVILIDLDGFKGVNDSFGHAAGDAVLREVAERLLNTTRGRDLVSRFGGDEFAVLLEGLHQESDTTIVAERIVASLHEPIVHSLGAARVGASLGIARPDPNSLQPASAASLLHEADVALYRAKNLGKGRWVRFDQGLLAPIAKLARHDGTQSAAVADATVPVSAYDGVDRRIATSSSVMSIGMSAKSGVVR
jgi:diguanylate cyclase (GGDEF)-like protein